MLVKIFEKYPLDVVGRPQVGWQIRVEFTNLSSELLRKNKKQSKSK
jgi:hypothetical protein